jgi:hypothetical protein
MQSVLDVILMITDATAISDANIVGTNGLKAGVQV